MIPSRVIPWLVLGCLAGCESSILVPIRECTLEGTSPANGITVPEGAAFAYASDTGRQAMADRLSLANDVFLPQADMVFIAQGTPLVIRDPSPTDGRARGDIDVTFGIAGHSDAVAACEAAWQSARPSAQGLIVINARLIQRGANVGGLTTPVPPALRWGGARFADLCAVPRQLRTTDISAMAVAVSDVNAEFLDPLIFDPALILAHELAHALTLGHGNGLDDNADGALPPTTGLRTYDGYCDRLGVDSQDQPREDAPGSPRSLMSAIRSAHLTPLQIEQLQDAAILAPGAGRGQLTLGTP